MTYFAFVYSCLLRGIAVYANTTANHLSQLIVQNYILLRVLQYKSIKSHSTDFIELTVHFQYSYYTTIRF